MPEEHIMPKTADLVRSYVLEKRWVSSDQNVKLLYVPAINANAQINIFKTVKL